MKKIVPDRRYYVILAINRNDPNDILGYVENSFSMGWSVTNVCLWTRYNTKKAYFDNINKYNSDAAYRKQMQHHEGESAERCFDYMTFQHEWNWAKNYPTVVPQGYEVKIFRAFSKNCPVQLDLRLRRTPDIDKWRYRNAPFIINKFHVKFGGLLDFPTDPLTYKGSQIDLKKFKVENVKKNLSKKELREMYIKRNNISFEHSWEKREFEENSNIKKILRREAKMRRERMVS